MSDVNEHLIAHLKARAIEGMAEYGVPLLPFNGRNPLRDKREELLDALVYNEQDIMEREAIADLLMQAGYFMTSMEDNHPDAVASYMQDSRELTSDTFFDMAAKLRADCERSVSVGIPDATYLFVGMETEE